MEKTLELKPFKNREDVRKEEVLREWDKEMRRTVSRRLREQFERDFKRTGLSKG